VKRFLEWGLILVIVGSVLAFGAVEPLAYSLMEASILLLVFALLFAQARQGKVDLPIPLAMLPIIFLVFLQIVPLPPQLVAWLSPARLVPAASGTQAPAGSAWITLSIYPHDTVAASAKLLAYCGAFMLSAVVFDPLKRRSALVQSLILLGCFEAAYGTIQYLTGYQKIFTFTKIFYTAEATGTYINRNHFAGFLELVIPLLVARVFYLLLRQHKREHEGFPPGRRERPSSSLPEVLFYSFVTVVLLLGAFYSRSRMGVFSIIVSLILMALLGQLKIGHRAWVSLTLIILACAIGYAFWIGMDPIFQRFEVLTRGSYIERSESRILLWRSAVSLIKDYPLFGTGLGTFGFAYRRFQVIFPNMFVDHAHCDYIEFASDVGLLGSVLLFAPIFYLLGKMLRAFLSEQSRYRRSVLLGCIGSVSAMLIHTLVDFNLQIPANALVFAVILGMGYKVACLIPRVGMENRIASRDVTHSNHS
jgi:O-antigen ligase